MTKNLNMKILLPQRVNNLFEVVSSSHKIFLTLWTDLKCFSLLILVWFVKESYTLIES